jgi:hypothetical protein
MNEYLTESLIEAKEATGIRMEELSVLESLFFRNKVIAKYMQNSNAFPLWERIQPGYGLHDPKAWHWLDDFLEKKEIYFFFDESNNPITYILNSGQSLVIFLHEFPKYVYYITNESLDFLICFNDHGYLIASGTAEPWLRNKVKELSKTGWVDMEGKSY